VSRWLPLFGDRAVGFMRDEREAARVLMRHAGVGLAMTAALFRLTQTNCEGDGTFFHRFPQEGDRSRVRILSPICGNLWKKVPSPRLCAGQEIELAEAPAA
jgi:hypothetical protein